MRVKSKNFSPSSLSTFLSTPLSIFTYNIPLKNS